MNSSVRLVALRAPASRLASLRPAPLLAFLLALSAAPASAQAPSEVREAAGHVVTLRGHDVDGHLTAQGSAFFFGPGRIATNFHVIRGAATVHVIDADGDTLAVTSFAEAVDERLDLAILPAPEDRSRGLIIETFIPVIGDRVWTYGSPKGLTGTMSDGIVSAVRERGGRQVLQISAPISAGSSGGPVLNAAGRVIGVTVSSVRGGQNLNFAVPARELARLAARPAERIELPVGERRAPELVAGDDGGEVVTERPELPDRWQFLSRNVSDAELFYDEETLQRDGERLRVWIYTFYPETLMAGEAAFDAAKALFELRCDAGQFRLNQYLLMRGENVIGSNGSVSGGEWSAIAPESVAEQLLGTMCEAPAPAAAEAQREPDATPTTGN